MSETKHLHEVMAETARPRLSCVMHHEAARDWLRTPNPLLGDRIPEAVLRQDPRAVCDAVDALAEGVFV